MIRNTEEVAPAVIASLRSNPSPVEEMRRNKQFYVYILANKTNVALYVGVTSNLKARVFQHKEHLVEGFTKRYDINKLVCYEILGDAPSAIAREKQIKGGSRARKNLLVETMNPEWRDLYDEI